MSAEVQKERGKWSRFSIGAQVTLTVLLAVAAAGMLTWLSERPGLRWKKDLTASQENTLSPKLMTVLDTLPDGDPVDVDVFFRPAEMPLTAVAAEAQARFFKTLILADSSAAGRMRVHHHKMMESSGPQAEYLLRMRELDVEEVNVVVFSRGKLRSQHRLLGEIADIDIGNPRGLDGAYEPPSISAFRAEEALILGLRKVTQQGAPKLYFSTGQQERDIFGESDLDMGLLHSALLADGFDVSWWDPNKDGPVPEDCDALAIVGPATPFSEAAIKALQDYAYGGGSLLVAPHLTRDQEGTASALLASFGLRTVEGIVSEPYAGPNGQLGAGNPRVTLIQTDASEMLPHTITDPLRRAGRRLQFALTRSFQRDGENLPKGAHVLNLIRSDDLAWVDTADENGQPNYRHDEAEVMGTHTLVSALTFPAKVSGDEAKRRDSRVLAVGSADFFANRLNPYNQDFLVNSLNWLAHRELRVKVVTADPDFRRVDLQETTALATTGRVTVYILPGIFLMLGLVVFFMRRRV